MTALKVGKQLDVPQPKHAPFAKLPRNECMITVSGGGKTNAHIQTLTQKWGLAGLFGKCIVMSVNAFTDPNYKVLADYIERTTGQKKEDCFFHRMGPTSSFRHYEGDERSQRLHAQKQKGPRSYKALFLSHNH